MSEYVLPLAIDPHVHGRGFDQSYKETFRTASMAAVAGGVGTILLMPNYEPRDKRPYSLEKVVGVRNEIYWEDTDHKTQGPYCDIGVWATSLPGESMPRSIQYFTKLVMGNKFYVEITQGQDETLTVDDFIPYARAWHENASMQQPVAAHVEDEHVEEAIAKIAREVGHALYIPHINNRFLLDAVISAKKRDLPVFAAVTLDHLFHTEEAVEEKGWYARMKPPLATEDDQQYIWDHIDYVDCFETDHAPHTKQEKDLANEKNPEGKTGKDDVKSFGTPTLEAFMPRLFTAYKEGLLTSDQLIEKTSTNAARIFGIKQDKTSTVKIVDEPFEFGSEHVFSKSGWNAFEGETMLARVAQVDIRGITVFHEGKFTDVNPQGKVISPV